ncbi:unnamed protein product [Musa hybrid cultivar]
MRGGLSAILQTLTPEAASVLTRSVEEAARRKHGQTTPLHVAATLVAAPSGLLRRACVSSLSDTVHPLRCRALDLCFSVALDRLPCSSSSSSGGGGGGGADSTAEPPMSNALKAALKRAQAHQRRGCPEQQQTPLLAVKVELAQLVISILDDPSVSRVMREASFSSTAVKAVVEQSLSSSSSSSSTTAPASTFTSPASPALFASSLGGGLSHNLSIHASPARNLYMNPRFYQHRHSSGATAGGGLEEPRREEVKRVMDILLRSEKRNPVLVGDSHPDAVMKEVLQKIESGDAPPPLQTAQVVSFAKQLATAAVASDLSWIPAWIRELGASIETEMSRGHGVVLDLGDLSWLVESPGGASIASAGPQTRQIVCEVGRVVVAEMGKLVKSFEDHGRLWLVGTATSATYLRCQVYYPAMENDWDLQVLPIASRPRIFPKLGVIGNLSSSAAAAITRSQPPDGADSSGKILCSVCMESYKHQLARLVTEEIKKSPSKVEDNKALPKWLQLAKLSNGGGTKPSTSLLQAKEEEQELMGKQSTEELLKKWQDTCSRLHPSLSHTVLLGSPQPDSDLTLFRNLVHRRKIMLNASSEQPCSLPRSPVKTDLVLGNSRASNALLEKTHAERVKDFTECTQDGFSIQQRAKVTGISEKDAFKRLLKGLTEKVGWQQEAASAIATALMHSKPENWKRPGGGAKGDTWLLLIGPDKVGKRTMATALSETLFGTAPTMVRFSGTSTCSNGDDGESNMVSRGRTPMDRVSEAVRRNPFSVVVLEDIDQADGVVQGGIKRAMERGRLLDSYGREVSLGSVIFVLTSSWLPEELKSRHESLILLEEKILHSVGHGWQLELSAEKNPGKRCADWLGNGDQPTKLRKQSSCGVGISLDLNLAVAMEDAAGEGSWNSSDLTTEHEHENGRLAVKCSTSSSASRWMELVENTIMFNPVDFSPLRRTVSDSISTKFATVMGDGCSIKVDEDAADRIVAGAWLAGAAFDEWSERVLIPNLRQLKCNLQADDGVVVVRLSVVKGGPAKSPGDREWLPTSVAIAVDGLWTT